MTVIDARNKFYLKQAMDSTTVTDMFTEQELLEAYRTCRRAAEISRREYFTQLCELIDDILKESR